MKSFAPIDGILLLSGCKIFTKNRLLKMINNSFKILIVIVYVVESYLQYQEIPRRLLSRPLINLSYFQRILFSILFMIIMWRVKNRVAKMMATASKSLSAEQKRCLRRHSFICVLISSNFCHFLHRGDQFYDNSLDYFPFSKEAHS